MRTDLCLLISTTWCISTLTKLLSLVRLINISSSSGFICLQYFKLLEIIKNNPSSPLLPWPFWMKKAIKLKKRKGKKQNISVAFQIFMTESGSVYSTACCFSNDPLFCFISSNTFIFRSAKAYTLYLSRYMHQFPEIK